MCVVISKKQLAVASELSSLKENKEKLEMYYLKTFSKQMKNQAGITDTRVKLRESLIDVYMLDLHLRATAKGAA
jgi:hypothetical protein